MKTYETWTERFGRYATNVMAALALALICGPVTAVIMYTRWMEFAPLRYPSPQIVQTDEPLENGLDAVFEGGSIRVKGEKCNDSKEDIAVSGHSWWVRREPRVMVPFRQGTGIRQPGCESINYVNQLPPEVTEGVWRLEGREEAVSGSRRQAEGWYTQWFVVKKRPGQ